MQTNDRLVWKFPFEMIYKTRNIDGWPKIIISMTSRNYLGKDMVCGYGVMHVPTQPGTHVRYAQIFKPRSSSLINDIISSLMGNPPELKNAIELLNGTQGGRETLCCENVGTMKLSFTTATKGMKKLGFHSLKN